MSYPDSFHNTTDEANIEDMNARAETQEDKILAFFRKHPDRSFTPFQVHRIVLPGSPVTSIRRGITNLTEAGLLLKTDLKVTEVYGMSNYTWRLNADYCQGRLF